MNNTLEQLKLILNNYKDKGINVIGTTCIGKTTLLKNIPEGIEISKLAPKLTSSQEDFYYNAPYTKQNREIMIGMRSKRAIVKPGQTAFGTGITQGAELIIYLSISDKLLKERTRNRKVGFKLAKQIPPCLFFYVI